MAIEHAVILSAGKGSRLLPLTENRPKCLIDFSGRSLLEWQLDALFDSGIKEAVVVTGFRSDLVDQVIAARGASRGRVTTLFNPFYHVADNLGSVWMARSAFGRDTLLLNGDTLVSPSLVSGVLAGAEAPITVTVDEKTDYDEDDMKVLRQDGRLLRIGKELEPGNYNAESIGLLAFQEEGRGAFIDMVEETMRRPEGTSSFYLRVIDRLAPAGIVGTVSIKGEAWAEVDFPADLDAARALTGDWARQTATST